MKDLVFIKATKIHGSGSIEITLPKALEEEGWIKGAKIYIYKNPDGTVCLSKSHLRVIKGGRK